MNSPVKIKIANTSLSCLLDYLDFCYSSRPAYTDLISIQSICGIKPNELLLFPDSDAALYRGNHFHFVFFLKSMRQTGTRYGTDNDRLPLSEYTKKHVLADIVEWGNYSEPLAISFPLDPGLILSRGLFHDFVDFLSRFSTDLVKWNDRERSIIVLIDLHSDPILRVNFCSFAPIGVLLYELCISPVLNFCESLRGGKARPSPFGIRFDFASDHIALIAFRSENSHFEVYVARSSQDLDRGIIRFKLGVCLSSPSEVISALLDQKEYARVLLQPGEVIPVKRSFAESTKRIYDFFNIYQMSPETVSRDLTQLKRVLSALH